MPLVSAIVLNYRTPKEARRCVWALQKQSIAKQMEILIVDNHSNDESIQWLHNSFISSESSDSSDSSESSRSSLKVLQTRTNIGYGQGNNFAVTRAAGKYILIINPDNELEPDGLQKMVDAMERDASIGILAPQLMHDDGSIRDSFRTFPTPIDVLIKRSWFRPLFRKRMQRYLQHHEDPTRVRDVDWVAGACLLLRRDFYEELGGFDPRFFLFFEDTDLCRRAWKAGKRVVYFPLVKATDRRHRLSEGGVLSLFTKRATRIHLVSAIRYFWKWRAA